jgi:hypothetical protein
MLPLVRKSWLAVASGLGGDNITKSRRLLGYGVFLQLLFLKAFRIELSLSPNLVAMKLNQFFALEDCVIPLHVGRL